MNEFNIYCDESCHLEHDKSDYMVLGAIRCLKCDRIDLLRDIRDLKIRHGLDSHSEMKWQKVSNTKIDFYKDIIKYFFESDKISFRAIIVNKKQLNHEKFSQNHDDFYYKMYYQLLVRIIVPNGKNYIYLDIKDSKGGKKIRKLQQHLENGPHAFDSQYIANVQIINSKESELLQLADLLIGAISYVNRNLASKKDSSQAKKQLTDIISNLSGYSMKKSTFLSEEKFNLFHINLQ